jgi:tRNA threonylcarbamoyl adenosine modification protein (Sua5/YciO/YrdC/YwlC family)
MRLFKPLLRLLENRVSMALHVPIGDQNAEFLAVDLLKSGGVIAIPTDTVYGLACDATNITSVNRLYTVKCRNEEKPVAICLGNVSEINAWAKVEHLPKGLLETLLPGPVTLILTCANKLDKSLSFHGKVGIRIPDYRFIRAVTKKIGPSFSPDQCKFKRSP